MDKLNIAILFFLTLTGIQIVSCRKFVEIDLPETQITRETVFQNEETAIAAATGMYKSMLVTSNMIGGQAYPVPYLGGLSSDELTDYSNNIPYNEFFKNNLAVDNSAILAVWSASYNTIYESNAVLEGIAASQSLTPDVKKRLEGEAKFVRAFYYFYMVNLFGDVPLILSTQYQTNARASRTTSAEIYNQIVTDLKDAQKLLTESYFSGKRTRPNKWAATAMLARVYLYLKDYSKAEAEASSVIGSSMFSIVAEENNVFLSASNEAILQLSQLYPGNFPTGDCSNFLIVNNSFTKAVSMRLVNAFETGDQRKTKWLNTYTNTAGTYYYAYKYKIRVYTTDVNYPEYLMLLRLAEQYLIRAEARAQQDKISESKDDLNVIRTRAGLANTTANDKPTLLQAIEQERRMEFFCEMGHRWLDIKRTGRTEAILGDIKPDYQLTDTLYPIPEAEIFKNGNLNPQNAGY